MEIIDKISMIHMAVSDMDKAKEFYTKFGFEVTKDYGQSGKRWVSMVLPRGGTSIVLTTFFENLKQGTMRIDLSTPDIEVAYKDLKAKGVKPNNEIKDDPWARWFDVYDPDGNHWVIAQS